MQPKRWASFVIGDRERLAHGQPTETLDQTGELLNSGAGKWNICVRTSLFGNISFLVLGLWLGCFEVGDGYL